MLKETQQMKLRVSKELHEKIRKESFETRKSINNIMIELIESRYKDVK